MWWLLLNFPLAALFEGFVTKYVWNLYISPLGFHTMGLIQGFMLSLFVSYLIYNPQMKVAETSKEIIVDCFKSHVVRALTLLTAWGLHFAL